MMSRREGGRGRERARESEREHHVIKMMTMCHKTWRRGRGKEGASVTEQASTTHITV